MKQKCQSWIGIEQYKNAATPLMTKDINTTHQHFQMWYSSVPNKCVGWNKHVGGKNVGK